MKLIQMFLQLAAMTFCTAAFAEMAPPPGSYVQSCSNASLNGYGLYADCKTKRGNWVNSYLDLTQCSPSSDIGNNNGRLNCAYGHQYPVWLGMPYGSYVQSCSNAFLQGHFLSADCRLPNGRYEPSTLDLDACQINSDIGNNYGRLNCAHF